MATIEFYDKKDHHDATDLFGSTAEVEAIYQACENAYHNALPSNKYKGCYIAPTHPSYFELRMMRDNESPKMNLKAYCDMKLAEWRKANPAQYLLEEYSRKIWDEQNNLQHQIIVSIAADHNLYPVWLGGKERKGPCMPDQWMLYKDSAHTERVACIHCI